MKITTKIIALIVLLVAAAAPVARAGSSSKTCIVSGEPLGGDNGPPIEVSAKGRKVLLCCKSCVKKFNANPDKYLAMLAGKK